MSTGKATGRIVILFAAPAAEQAAKRLKFLIASEAPDPGRPQRRLALARVGDASDEMLALANLGKEDVLVALLTSNEGLEPGTSSADWGAERIGALKGYAASGVNVRIGSLGGASHELLGSAPPDNVTVVEIGEEPDTGLLALKNAALDGVNQDGRNLGWARRLRRAPGWSRLVQSVNVVSDNVNAAVFVGGAAVGLFAFLGWFGLNQRDVRVLDGDVSLAVAGFGGPGGEGSGREALDDLALSYWSTASEDLKERSKGGSGGAPALTVDVLSPTEAEPLQATSIGELKSQAESIAETHKADVVFSAEVSKELRTVRPILYVAPQAVPDASEFAGLYYFGPAIETMSPVDDNAAARAQVREGLAVRSNAMSEFVVGLARYRNGDYDAARENFDSALELWPGEEGNDMIQLFLGNTALKQEKYEEAREWYERGLDPPGQTADRLRLALLEVEFHESRDAQCTGRQATSDIEAVRKGYEELRLAGSALTSPTFSSRVSFGLARTTLCLAARGAGFEYPDAVPFYLDVVQRFEDGDELTQGIAAESVAGLGFIATQMPPDWDLEGCGSASECYSWASDLAIVKDKRAAYEELAKIN